VAAPNLGVIITDVIRTARRLGVGLFVGGSVLGLCACGYGKPTVDTKSAEQSVIEAVAQSRKVTASNAVCPDGIEAKADVIFDCTFTSPDGQRHVAHLEITKVEGKMVQFSITADLS
jgi:uncharacterized protein DUF4333